MLILFKAIALGRTGRSYLEIARRLEKVNARLNIDHETSSYKATLTSPINSAREALQSLLEGLSSTEYCRIRIFVSLRCSRRVKWVKLSKVIRSMSDKCYSVKESLRCVRRWGEGAILVDGRMRSATYTLHYLRRYPQDYRALTKSALFIECGERDTIVKSVTSLTDFVSSLKVSSVGE
jgi:hypothetical protein